MNICKALAKHAKLLSTKVVPVYTYWQRWKAKVTFYFSNIGYYFVKHHTNLDKLIIMIALVTFNGINRGVFKNPCVIFLHILIHSI